VSSSTGPATAGGEVLIAGPPLTVAGSATGSPGGTSPVRVATKGVCPSRDPQACVDGMSSGGTPCCYPPLASYLRYVQAMTQRLHRIPAVGGRGLAEPPLHDGEGVLLQRQIVSAVATGMRTANVPTMLRQLVIVLDWIPAGATAPRSGSPGAGRFRAPDLAARRTSADTGGSRRRRDCPR